jgi:exosome complex exonuclease RRP6
MNARPSKTGRIASSLRDQRIEKPQLKFDHVPTNDGKAIFKPLLQSKPHAIVPLATEPVASESGNQLSYASLFCALLP